MSDWHYRSLSEIIDKSRAITYGIVQPGPDISPDGIPLIRGKDYSSGVVSTEGLYHVLSEIDKPYQRSKVKKGDILLSIAGYVGKVAIVPKELEGANLTQTTARLSINKNAVEPEFIYHVLNSSNFKREVKRYEKGSAQSGLNLADVGNFKILITPDLKKQQKIANILSTVDNLIDQTQNLINKYTSVKEGMMSDLFSRGIDLSGTPETNKNYGQLRPSYKDAPELYQETELGYFPKQWKIQSLKERIEVSYGKSQVAVRDNDGSIPVYGTGGFIEYANSTMSETDSILIGRKGTLNNPYYIKAPFWIVDTAYFVSKFIDGDMTFLAKRLSTFDFVKLNESTGVPSLNRETLYREKLAFPPLYEQIEINRRIEAVDKYLDRYNAEKIKTINIKKGLMQDLLTGKVKV